MDVQAARDGIDKVLRILGSEYQYAQPVVRYLREARAALEDDRPVSLTGEGEADDAPSVVASPKPRKREEQHV